MAKRARGKSAGGEAVPAVRWFSASDGGGLVVLAMLTDEGPSAYAMSHLDADLMADALRAAAASVLRAQA